MSSSDPRTIHFGDLRRPAYRRIYKYKLELSPAKAARVYWFVSKFGGNRAWPGSPPPLRRAPI